MGNFLQSQKAKFILGGVGLYLLTSGVSYFVFSALISTPVLSPAGVQDKRAKIDTSLPKTEECPLNGGMYTKAEREVWEKRRPLTVSIENHEEARPQSGLSKADIVYEAIAEGGVTRFLSVFYCGVAAEETQVGPVRSARIYFMDWASEYGEYPLYVHVGGANKPGPADALGAVRKYGWEQYNDLNQFSIGFPTFWRDYERFDRTVATEHTMYSTTDKLWTVAEKRGLFAKDKKGNAWDEDFVKWPFVDGKAVENPTATKISFPFWEGQTQYAVAWNYDSASNSYKRENGGQIHKDMNNDQQVSAANVVILYTKSKGPIDELKHMLYDTIGSGKALVFQNGNVIQATWKKTTRSTRTRFTDAKGKEISFVRGPIWIEVTDPTSKVTY
ncbi:MAG: hypothetical protein G01um10145_198 [Microgenomates group bacterium Gr01-1014_5]|nr:MAG: hypothetical protein G01um10145_198 [Microgenomates group bacterium Gr01-1014_5]